MIVEALLVTAAYAAPHWDRGFVAERPRPERSQSGAAVGSSAAERPKRGVRQSLFFELLGSGILYSVNYEVRLPSDLSLRVGVGTVGADARSGVSRGSFTMTTLPVSVGYAFGGREHKVELSAGSTLVWYSGEAQIFVAKVTRSGFAPLATGFVGYRFVPERAGVMARIGFTPLLAFEDGLRFVPWGGVAVGGTI